ncbi:MAG TPA: flippase-like domain-containing protein [Bacteroidetes bacterium]|nr:flippase-like domain-containing protein [Bacteroidota bacterium]
MLKKRFIQVAQYLFFLGIGILLLWLSVRHIDLNKLWHDILRADYWWLFLSLGFALLSHIARALRWNLLISSLGYKTRLWPTFFSVMIGYLANTAVPRMGEIVRCGTLSKKEKIPFNALFGTVIAERFFDLIVLALIIFFTMVFQLSLVSDFLHKILDPIIQSVFSDMFNIILFTVFILLMLAGIAWFVWAFRHRIKKITFYEAVKDFLNGLWNGIKTIIKLRQKGLFLFYTVVIWLFYAVMTYLPFKMLSETSHLTFVDGLTLMALGSLGIVAPVPGGIGTYHYIVKVILTEIYGVQDVAAMSYATIVHAGQTMFNVIVGAASYVLIGILARKQKPLN